VRRAAPPGGRRRRPAGFEGGTSLAFSIAMRAGVILPALGLLVIDATGPAARAATDVEDPEPPSPAAVVPAPATEVPGPPDHARSSAVYSIVGFGTPVGFFGVEGVHRFGSWFEISAGLGEGLAAAGSSQHPPAFHALQWSVMPRLRLGDDHLALTLGAGLSGGNYGAIPLDFECASYCNQDYPVRYVVWGNVEAGLELWKRGFAFRAFGGYARGCTTDGCVGLADRAPLGIPYFGVGFGYAF
jgi:hypothetical protein